MMNASCLRFGRMVTYVQSLDKHGSVCVCGGVPVCDVMLVFVSFIIPTFVNYPTSASHFLALDNISISFSWEGRNDRWKKSEKLNLNICVWGKLTGRYLCIWYFIQAQRPAYFKEVKMWINKT